MRCARRLRRLGWLALLLGAGCAGGAPRGDHWGVRRESGPAPAIVSLSEVNADKPDATAALQAIPLLGRARGAHRVAVHAEAALAPGWTPRAARMEPELLRALDWLERIAPQERGVHLQATLVGRDARREASRRHPADAGVVIDLLFPVDADPASRSAAVARALGVALHEAVHALRADGGDRADDEYRASLVEACYLLDTARAGDAFAFEAADASTADAGPADFTMRHSRDAAARVMAELQRAAGVARIGPHDTDALRRARAFCHARMATEA